MLRVKSCAVEGCDSNLCTDGSETRRFRFPRDEVRCRLWVERCRNRGLLSLNVETLYGSKRICGKHFERNAFVNDLQQRLVHDAVPSVFHFNVEECDVTKEPMIWTPTEKDPNILQRKEVDCPIQPEAKGLYISSHERNPKLSKFLVTERTNRNLTGLKLSRYNDNQNDPSLLPIFCKNRTALPNSSIKSSRKKPALSGNINIQHTSVSKNRNPLLLTPCGAEKETNSLMDLEPNILEKHMELFQQSEGKEFLIVGEVCMIAEKDPNQMCGSAKCNDDLYSSKRAEKLVRCWSKCKRWFHLRCTDLTTEEYNVLSNKESLRWLCEECCKDDVF